MLLNMAAPLTSSLLAAHVVCPAIICIDEMLRVIFVDGTSTDPRIFAPEVFYRLKIFCNDTAAGPSGPAHGSLSRSTAKHMLQSTTMKPTIIIDPSDEHDFTSGFVDPYPVTLYASMLTQP